MRLPWLSVLVVVMGFLRPATPDCLSEDGKYDYDEVLSKSLLFYEAQRSGFLPASQRVTWRRDSATDDALDPETNKRIDLEGGYYDAGDYVKFGFPMAGAATVLAWGAVEYAEAYEAAGEMTNMLAAVKWATDYFIKAHVAPNVFYGQVGIGDLDHAYWGRPEDMTMSRPAYKITESKPGSDLAGETAASLAAASILFKDFDPGYSATCLSHARELYDFANNYRGKYADSITDAAKFYYSWGTYDDELAWGAIWLYRATGEAKYLTQAKEHYNKININGVEEFSWAEKTPGAMVLLGQLVDAADKNTYLGHLKNFCDKMVNVKTRTPKGLLYLSQWGSLRYTANVVLVCLRAADLGIESQIYREFGKQQIHYMLGSTGRSFVVGYGNNSPQRPHHASSSCNDPPEPCTWNDFNSPDPNPHILYGALVGGPDNNDNYVDARNDYIMNEVTCDYNAGFQSAVAALRLLAGCGNATTGTTSSPVTTSNSTVSTSAPVTTTDSVATNTPSTTTTSTPATTTSTPTTTTSTPTTTTNGGSLSTCTAMVQQTNEWSGNFQANLIIEIPFNTQSWSIKLTFSGEVTQFQVWTANPSGTPNNIITLTNKYYNGMQIAGNTLTINFIASFSGMKPEVTSITFNNNVCDKDSTPNSTTTSAPATTVSTTTSNPETTTNTPTTTTSTSTTTTSTSTTTTPSPTTNGGTSSSCATMVQQTNEWSGNFQANLIIKIPLNTQSWSIKLTFSGKVTQFQVWVANASPSTPTSTITLTNKSYNGMQTAGNILTINFIASFSGIKPVITSIIFNNDLLCGVSSVTPITTTIPPPAAAACATIEQENEWSGNFKSILSVPIPFDTNSWSIGLTFSGEVTNFQVWRAIPSSTPSSSITLTNMSYNGYQKAGETLTMSFIVSFSGTKPQIKAFTFNDTPLCLN